MPRKDSQIDKARVMKAYQQMKGEGASEKDITGLLMERFSASRHVINDALYGKRTRGKSHERVIR